MSTRLNLIFVLALVLSACTTPIATPTAPQISDSAAPMQASATPPTSASATPLPASPTLHPTATATPAPTDTPKPTATSTATSTLTPMPTATHTAAPTLTPTPTPELVKPGTYKIGNCDVIALDFGIEYEFCVDFVTVTRQDRHLVFDVSWRFLHVPHDVTVTKPSYAGVGGLYLVDNLGNRYAHIAGGGAAYQSVVYEVRLWIITGWFDFGPLQPGATTFTLYDDTVGFVISNIALTRDNLYYGEYLLTHYPGLLLEYQLDAWEPVKAQDAADILTNKEMPTCTLQERPYQQPQGKFKNKTAIGSITYEIYGYIQGGLGYREYIAVDGLPGLGGETAPFFLVTIPLDNSAPCLDAINAVLARLVAQEP